MKLFSTRLAVILCALFAPIAPAQENSLEESRALATALMQQLGAALKKEMAAGGPDAAIKVCTQIAPELATKFSLENGWRVTRVSLKTRNPLLGTPDIWEQHALKDFDARAAAGAAADKLDYSETVTEPGGRYFRYVKALTVQPLCLACHGGTDQISEPVKATLKAHYPHDRAVGYVPGQIRGAISIKRPIA